tara:strand:+ start:532 stop:1989 length:1458 start_codon:yes stop_codon:yes gene_type:complete
MFKQWCKEQGFLNNSNVSHVLMDGGVLSVPFDRLNDLYEKCVDSYKNGEKIFVVEQKTENYNFFMDLDYKDEHELSLDQVESICKVICDKVNKFNMGESLISVAEPKPAGKLTKTGIHINWPGFIVNRSSALALREHVINTLTLAYGSKKWEDIVDSAVYGSSERKTKGSGFRMPWSHKRGKHETCSGQGCKECNNTGKITQGEYLPVYIYKGGKGPFTLLQPILPNPDVKILHMATLRTQSTEPKIIEGTSHLLKNEGSFTSLQLKNEFKDQEVMGLIQSFINKHLEGQVSSRVTKMFECNNQFLVSTNSFYCENKKCNHNSNHVWFHILGDTIAQKCFSTTDIMRHYGFCKDFTGKRHKLPPKITKLLYKDGKIEKYVAKKNFVKKPFEEHKHIHEDVNELLLKFIQKYMITKEQVFSITNIEQKKQKNKSSKLKEYSIQTTYTCDLCNSNNVSFDIIKNKIEKKCKCENRKHFLPEKIVTKL